MKKQQQTLSSREAAFHAVLGALQGKGYIGESLDAWDKTSHPDSSDFRLALEIAFGSTRRALSLDHILAQCTDRGKLSFGLKEKVLLRMGAYQHIFMDRIPSHAVVNETVALAKKHCHSSFANFANAILRKLITNTPPLPQGQTAQDLSIRHSYPLYFVEKLIAGHGEGAAIQMMEVMNQPTATMVRIRQKGAEELVKGIKRLPETSNMATVEETSLLPWLAASEHYYIQNATPVALIDHLCKRETPPKRILDLCAAPGGKTLAAYDHYPQAAFTANDISPEKIFRLEENFAKYHIPARVTCSMGEDFIGTELYDVVIVDAPCSNSGVLHKRPEARWRLSKETSALLEEKQLKLIGHANALLNKGGEIWYMTCSILKEENENLVERACKRWGLKISHPMHTILPNMAGWDGGFAAKLSQQTF